MMTVDRRARIVAFSGKVKLSGDSGGPPHGRIERDEAGSRARVGAVEDVPTGVG
jgi:hypothetical protein